MIQEIGKYRYRNTYRPDVRPSEDDRILFYRGREILVSCSDNGISFLTFGEVRKVCPYREQDATYLFSIDQTSYFLFREFEETVVPGMAAGRSEPDSHQVCDGGMPELFPGFTWEKIERLRICGPREAAFAGVTGMQLYSWYRSRRFCPACGRKMIHSQKERMMHCEDCV